MPSDSELRQDETVIWAVPLYENHLSLRANRYSYVEAGHGWRSSCALLTGRPVAGQGPRETFLNEREIDLLIEALERAKKQIADWRADA